MADISVIQTPDGNSYNIKDATARSDLSNKADKADVVHKDGQEIITGLKLFNTMPMLRIDGAYFSIGNASIKSVASSIATSSTETTLPTCEAVASFVEGKGYTTNTGDVVGPSSSTNDRIALFDGTTGKLLKQSDYTTSSFASSTHTHGNITNAGALQTTDITIANGDKLVVTDSSNSALVSRASISFDGSTETQCLTKKGTWANFTNNAGTITGITMNGSSKGTSGVVDLGTVLTSDSTYVKTSGNQTIAGTKTFSSKITGSISGNCDGTASNVTGTIAIANGGTGATTVANARKALFGSNLASTATYLIGITDSWVSGGYVAISSVPELIGLTVSQVESGVTWNTTNTDTTNSKYILYKFGALRVLYLEIRPKLTGGSGWTNLGTIASGHRPGGDRYVPAMNTTGSNALDVDIRSNGYIRMLAQNWSTSVTYCCTAIYVVE